MKKINYYKKNRIYTIIKEISDNAYLISDEFGEAEVPIYELEIIIEDKIPIDLRAWEDALVQFALKK